MAYKLGVVGIGHWFKRLHIGVQRVSGLVVSKGVGTKPYAIKAQMLQQFKISPDMYYTVDETTGKIPDAFYEGVDVVQIADPNRFHSEQTKEALSKGKKVVTEKSFAVSEQEYSAFLDFVKANKKELDVFLHLHYIDKMPTQELKADAADLLKKFGRIKSVQATFFEPANAEDAGRVWLFGPENGGLFMDWIHPFEVVYYLFGSGFGSIRQLQTYATNLAYDKVNPTGIYCELELKGANYAPGATIQVRIAKGIDKAYGDKAMRFVFESGDYIRLSYISSETEFTSSNRGQIEQGKTIDGKFVSESSKLLIGENSSDRFAEQIIELCQGKNTGFTLDQVTELFRPQWEYLARVKSIPLEKSDKKIKEFLQDGKI